MTTSSQYQERSAADHFDQFAEDWWNPEGSLRTLHDINPARINYIQNTVDVNGLSILDIGCGGGILSESLAGLGARVTGIDISKPALDTAMAHSRSSGLSINYLQSTPEEFLENHGHRFDVITCMEILEHVSDPAAVIAVCSQLVKPGGHIFLSTINRSLKAYIFAIFAAEYLFDVIPAGTHEYGRFIRPGELTVCCEQNNLEIEDIRGLRYIPFIRKASLTPHPDINYLVHARKN